MLFTKSTESGIQLENAMILPPELFAKTQIPANTARILEWARDNRVNVAFNINGKSAFNCRIGVMMDSEVSDGTYITNKKMLKHAGEELTEFLKGLPSNVDDAADEAIVVNEIDKAVKEFSKKINEIDSNLIVKIAILKLKNHE